MSLGTSAPDTVFEGPEGFFYQSRFNSDELAEEYAIPVWLVKTSRIAATTLSFAQNGIFADISNTKVTDLPNGWSGTSIQDLDNVVGPDFRNRSLRRLVAKHALLIGADFSGSDLTAADFAGADLRGMKYASFVNSYSGWGVFLAAREFFVGYKTGVNILIGNIRNANFDYADLRFARIWVAGLQGSTFFRANLRGASLGTITEGPRSLIGADLRGAVVNGNGWAATLFYGARLEGADLSGLTDVSVDNLAYVTVDENTKLPRGISPPILGRPPTELATKLLAITPCLRPGGESNNANVEQRKCVEVAASILGRFR